MICPRSLVRLSIVAALACAPAAAAPPSSRPATIDVEIGAGYDTNPTLAPADPYFDQRLQAVVAPEEHGTPFLPLKLRGSYRPGDGDLGFLARYQVRGEFFTASEATNADELFARIDPGLEWLLGGEGRRRAALRATPFVSYNREQFFDRDSGDDFEVGTSGVADRYTYTATGAAIEYRGYGGERVEFSLGGLFEDRSYDELDSISSLDQQRYRFGGDVGFDIGRRAGLTFDYGYTVRSFDERPSRSLDGRALLANPPREYSYQEAGASLRSRLAERFTLYVDYGYRERQDDFEGYHDYQQDTFGLRLLYRGARWHARLAPKHWTRDYDHAFVFDLPANPVDGSPNARLSYETWQLDLGLERALTGPLSLVLDASYRDESCEDPRYAYEREQVSAGIRWRP